MSDEPKYTRESIRVLIDRLREQGMAPGHHPQDKARWLEASAVLECLFPFAGIADPAAFVEALRTIQPMQPSRTEDGSLGTRAFRQSARAYAEGWNDCVVIVRDALTASTPDPQPTELTPEQWDAYGAAVERQCAPQPTPPEDEETTT